ncbi:MAG: DUF4832 domain-containing protein [Flavobacteriales bacterium]
MFRTTNSTAKSDYKYSGLSPTDFSPFYYHEYANHGIQNPERGYEIKAGVIDIFTTNYSPDPSFEFSYPQYQLKGDAFYENISSADNTIGWSTLEDYIMQNDYCRDGISLVEIEEYVNFTEDNLLNQTPLRTQDLEASDEVFNYLKRFGLKARLIMNSSFQTFQNYPVDSITLLNPLYDPYKFDEASPLYDQRKEGLQFYLNQMRPHYTNSSKFIANVNAGWLSFPWDNNTYRHSDKWMESNYDNWQLYPIGYERSPFGNYSTTITNLTNEKNTYRESKQKFDWNTTHGRASAAYIHQSNSLEHYTQTRAIVLVSLFHCFDYQKVLLASPVAFMRHATFLGAHGSLQVNPAAHWLWHYPYHGHAQNFWTGHLSQTDNTEPLWGHMFNDSIGRFGLYDGAFAGDTYDHAWTISGGEQNKIHWHHDYFTNEIILGVDWADHYIGTPNYLLRKYRQSFWNHGELPVFETTDQQTTNNSFSLTTNWTYTFNVNYNYFKQWYLIDEFGNIDLNEQYDYEVAEKITDGRLQDGLMSALKMRYFNYTSFSLAHNNKLDGRSYYEMHAPQFRNQSVISQWKVPDSHLADGLRHFAMPLSDLYFNDTRSPYDYIRDHLGYRLELTNAYVWQGGDGALSLKAGFYNRGFTAPQNPRVFYFVILDYNTNQILSQHEVSGGDIDWKTWYPDEFSKSENEFDNTTDPNFNDGIGNYEIGTHNSLEGKYVGGIPFGDYGDHWHHTPLVNQYTPIPYAIGVTIPNLSDGHYKFGLLAPDMDSTLSNDPKYAVKFANQTSYMTETGVTVLGAFDIVNGRIEEGLDSDVDGKPNTEDPTPYNPIEYNGGMDLPLNHPCNGFSIETPSTMCHY